MHIVHAAVGGINETDVHLADASEAVIIGFTRAPMRRHASCRSRRRGDPLYDIIYEVMEDMKAALNGLLAPEQRRPSRAGRRARGLPDRKVGTVAGCYVLEGVIPRGAKVRVLRGKVVVYDGELASLKHFKDDVREVKAGLRVRAVDAELQRHPAEGPLEVYEIVGSRVRSDRRGSRSAPARSVDRHAAMKKTSQRAHRVGDQLQRELADLLKNEVKDPRVGPVTITEVDVTSDLSHATVRFTHLAGKEQSQAAVDALARTAGFLRSELARRLDISAITSCISSTTTRSRQACACRS